MAYSSISRINMIVGAKAIGAELEVNCRRQSEKRREIDIEQHKEGFRERFSAEVRPFACHAPRQEALPVASRQLTRSSKFPLLAVILARWRAEFRLPDLEEMRTAAVLIT